MTKRAILWMAVSSEEQAAEDKASLEAQYSTLRTIAEREGWRVIDEIWVRGHSRHYLTFEQFLADATKAGITDPARMVDHWNRRDFDVLACWDITRIGREQSIVAQVFTLTARAGARVFTPAQGYIDDHRAVAALAGYSSASEVDKLVQRRLVGMRKRAEQGKSLGEPPFSHLVTYDERGKQSPLTVDRSKQRLWDDVATLVCEGVAWAEIEGELYRRFGHINPETGKRYTSKKFYFLLHNPAFWGNSAFGYNPRAGQNTALSGCWAFDASESAPAGLTVHYGTHEAVYAGEQAERVKAELRRRRSIVGGRTSPSRTKALSGLLVCAECGYVLGYRRDGNREYYGCGSRFYASAQTDCSQRRYVSVPTLKAWITTLLDEAVETQDIRAILPHSPAADNLASLRAEIAEVERMVNTLILDKANAHAAARNLYDQQITERAERLAILRDAYSKALASEQQALVTSERQIAALAEITRITVPALWQRDEREINQLLHQLFAGMRIPVDEGKPMGFARGK